MFQIPLLLIQHNKYHTKIKFQQNNICQAIILWHFYINGNDQSSKFFLERSVASCFIEVLR